MRLLWLTIAGTLAVLTASHMAQASSILSTTEALNQTVSVSELMLILGDMDHESASIRLALAQSLSSFKAWSSNVDCLFLEQDLRLQPEIDKFLADPSVSYAETIGAREIELFGAESAQTSPLPEALALAARTLKIKVFAADIDFNSPDGQAVNSTHTLLSLKIGSPTDLINKEAKVVIEGRSRLIAKRISSLSTQFACHQSIVVIGASHLDNVFFGVPVTPFQTYLLDQKLSSKLGGIASINCKGLQTKDQETIDTCKRLGNGESLAALVPGDRPHLIDFFLLAE